MISNSFNTSVTLSLNSEIIKNENIVLLTGGENESQQHPVFPGKCSANRANFSLQSKKKSQRQRSKDSSLPRKRLGT